MTTTNRKEKKKIHKNAAVYFYNKEHNAILSASTRKSRKNFHTQYLHRVVKKKKQIKTYKETAIREIKEETGIDIKEDELIEIGSTNTTKYLFSIF